jgi:hypothetical protein
MTIKDTVFDLQVRCGLAVPPRNPGKGYTSALRRLAVGDSVLLPKRIHQVAVIAKAAGITGKYAARTVEGGVRVWRTKE